ncbi:DUF559 domain-containing protein [Ilumatobacter sp.]|uniref:DUF559 domain-containing protein n=1 Tax=Ilumatobacter sp. TaxID=1967498 RepID=UPI003C516599
MKLDTLDRIARTQHGVVTRDQTGLSTSSWQRATTNGTLMPLYRNVARLVGTPDTARQRIIAATLAAGDGALASHRSAALLHGIPIGTPPPVDLILPLVGSPRTRFARGLDGVQVHRPSDMARLKPYRRDGIACTAILRTLLDLGAVAPHDVHGAVGHALTNDLATIDAIETVLQQHARRGRAGVTALRTALDDWAIDAKPADSVLEPAMRRLISAYGLPPVEFHASVGGREVDFRVVGTPIVIECDGWRYHGRARDQFERDRENDAEFAAHGWIVLRFTYRKITTRPSRVAAQIRGAIERWANIPAPDAA